MSVQEETELISPLEEATKKTSSKLLEWFRFTVLLITACFIAYSSIGVTLISGDSMNPTLDNHSLVFVNKLSSHIGTPKHGDVVLVAHDGYTIVKRVIGLPGDTVEIKKGTVFVNQQPVPEIYTIGKSNDLALQKVQGGHIFILGDNRTPGKSLDSRSTSVGQVPVSSIQGYAELSLLPFHKIMKQLRF